MSYTILVLMMKSEHGSRPQRTAVLLKSIMFFSSPPKETLIMIRGNGATTPTGHITRRL